MKFSIRSLLFLTMVIAIAVTGLMKKKSVSVAKVKTLISECNGTFHLDNETIVGAMWNIDPRIPSSPTQPTPGVKLKTPIRKMDKFGEEPAIRFIAVNPSVDQGSKLRSLLREYRGLSDVEIVKITGATAKPIEAFRLYPIAKLQNLRFLKISNANLDRKFFSALSRVEDLEVVLLNNCIYEIEDLEPLADSPNLAWVQLGRDFDREKLDRVRGIVSEVFLTLPLGE